LSSTARQAPKVPDSLKWKIPVEGASISAKGCSGLMDIGHFAFLRMHGRLDGKVVLEDELQRIYDSTGDVTMAAAAAEAKAQYSAIVLGATGNVGGRIVQLLVKNPLCKKVVVVTRRKTDAFADPKVSEVVVNMDRLEEEVAPHAQGVDVALAAFGVGKGSAKMPEEEVRKIEVAYPQAFCRAAKAGGARVCGVMTAAGADPEAGGEVREDHRREAEGCRVRQVRLPWGVPSCRHSRQLQHAGRPWLRHATAALGHAVQIPFHRQE
jgi:hypothetical protein